jgi:hypothetical protein
MVEGAVLFDSDLAGHAATFTKITVAVSIARTDLHLALQPECWLQETLRHDASRNMMALGPDQTSIAEILIVRLSPDHVWETGNVVWRCVINLADQAAPKAATQNSPRRHEEGAAIGPSPLSRAGREQQEAADDEVIDVTGDIGKIRATPAHLEHRQRHAETVGGRYFKSVSSSLHGQGLTEGLPHVDQSVKTRRKSR